MVMYKAHLFAQENHELRTAIKEESSKHKRSRTKIVHKGSLTIEEAQSLIQAQNIEAGGGDSSEAANQPSQRRVRAPPKCSNCGIIGHNRTKCPTINVV